MPYELYDVVKLKKDAGGPEANRGRTVILVRKGNKDKCWWIKAVGKPPLTLQENADSNKADQSMQYSEGWFESVTVEAK